MKKLLFTILFISSQLFVYSQTLSSLKEKKDRAAKEIAYTNNLLRKTSKSEKTTLNKVNLLQKQIEQRNTIIQSTNSEINIYQNIIDDYEMVGNFISNDLEKIKQEYAQMIQLAYRNMNAYDKVMFIFSADDFQKAYRRYQYIKQYTAYRKNQAETIRALQSILEDQAKKREELKSNKLTLVGETKEEADKLYAEKSLKRNEVQKLQKKKRTLRKKLKQQRKVEQQLENEIQRIIEEIARKNDKGDKSYVLTPEQKLIGNNFAQNKNRLPWPVVRGIITDRFGVHPHPVLKSVKIRNNGVTIVTEAGAKVRSVFKGEVSRVFGITGGNTAVIIRHGKYLSVYSNLRHVIVKKGDKVSIKQEIGTVYTDPDDGNKSYLKFQIWKENQKLNPEHWIGK